jgi:hypothetical protein
MKSYSNPPLTVNEAALTYTIENEHGYDRREVVGIHACFPKGALAPADIYNNYFKVTELSQVVGYGHSFESSRRAVRFVSALFNPHEAAAGDRVTPGTLRVEYQSNAGPHHTIFDNGLGGFIDPLNLLQSGSIDYTTGAIDLFFEWNERPNTWNDRFTGCQVIATWVPVDAISYPSQWQVTRAWQDGSVKQAKAWIGQEDGSPLFIPATTAIDIYVADQWTTSNPTQVSSGGLFLPGAWNGSSSAMGLFTGAEQQAMILADEPIHKLRGTNRIIVKQFEGEDSTYNGTHLPVYAVQADLATKMAVAASLRSEVKDNQWNTYRADVWDTNPHEENIVENPNFGESNNQGWMKVTQKRQYHHPRGLSAQEANRDLLSMNTYTYVPHNSRMAHVEMRVSNDYRGHDPHAHQYTQSVTLAGSGNTNLSLTHAHSGVWNFPADPNSTDWSSIKQCSVEFLDASGALVARDHYGRGDVISVAVDDRPIWSRTRVVLENQQQNEKWGSVDYTTGNVTILASAPGTVANIKYKSYVQMVGTVNGFNPTAQVFNSLSEGVDSSQYSFRVRVGKSSILAEGWDQGGVLDTQVGRLTPLQADNTVHHEVLVGASVTTTQAFNLGTNVHPGSVKLYLATDSGPTRAGNTRNSTWSGISIFADDDGAGGRGRSRNVNALSVDYTTGVGSITFSSAPGATLKLFASYQHDDSTPTVLGNWDRDGGLGHGELTLNLQGTYSNNEVYISYFPNSVRTNGSGFYHDPNAHAIGDVTFAHWQVSNDTDLLTHMEGTDWHGIEKHFEQAGTPGGKFFGDAPSVNSFTSSIYPFYQGASGGIPVAMRIWDARYDRASSIGSGATSGAYGYMSDGGSIFRNFFVYANNGATAANDNEWKAKKRSHVHGVPTVECQFDSRALTTFEATWKRVAPSVSATFGAKRYMNGAAFDRDSIVTSHASIANPTAYRALELYTADPGIYLMRQGELRNRYNSMWNFGAGEGPSDRNGSSIRPDMKWFENTKEGMDAGGAARINHSFVSSALFTGSTSVARFLTHAGMFSLMRAGTVGYKSPDSFLYGADLYRAFTGQSSPDGKYGNVRNVHPLWSPQWDVVGGTYVTQSLRGRGKGQNYGFAGAYNSSSNNPSNIKVVNGSGGATIRAFWNVKGGAIPDGSQYGIGYEWSENPYGDGSTFFGIRVTSVMNDTGRWSTIDGNRHARYLTRCAIAGSDIYHDVKSVTSYNGSYCDITIDPPYPANPLYDAGGLSSPLSWNFVSDVRKGQDLPWIRNDPRTFPQLRNGLYTNGAQQSGINGDVASHQAHFAGYEAWCLTGEWSTWDQIKFNADWNCVDLKDIQDFGAAQDHYEGQQRANMWALRSVVQAYDACNYLNDQAEFAFINDFGSGLTPKERYRGYITNRIRSYVDWGCAGEMDPNGNIATGRRKPLKNLYVDKSSGKADWDALSLVGAKALPYGDGTYTEGELVYGQGFNYLSIWEFGYGHPYIGAAWLMMGNDTTPMTLNQRRDIPGNSTVGDVLLKYWEGVSDMMVSWSFVDRAIDFVIRAQPGFVQIARANTSVTVQPISSGSSRFNSFPEEIGGSNVGVRAIGIPIGDAQAGYPTGLSLYTVEGGNPRNGGYSQTGNFSPSPTINNLTTVLPSVLYSIAADPAAYGFTPGQSITAYTGGGTSTWSLSLYGFSENVGLLEFVNEDIIPIALMPPKVFNRHYLSSQIYWLRGAPRRITNTAQASITSSQDADRIGHPIVNAKGEEITLYGQDSTFDAKDSHFPDDFVNDPVDWPPTAWHYGGKSGWSGAQGIGSGTGTPTVANNQPVLRVYNGGSEAYGIPESDFYGAGDAKHPSARPPEHAEAMCVFGGLSAAYGSAFLMVAYSGLPLVAKYHTDPYIAARAGDMMNRLIYQGIIVSQIKSKRNQGGETVKTLDIETSVTAGGVTGGFPYEDNPANINNGGQPSVATDRWSQVNYFRRREITSSFITTSVNDDDVFILDFDVLGILPNELYNGGLRDATVVVQRADGTEVTCLSKVVDSDGANNGDSYKMYVRFPNGMAAGSSIGSNTIAERWYLYTTSVTGPFPNWSNQSNLSAPFSTEADTVLYWDNSAIDGNPRVWRDVGPNLGWSGNNFQGLSGQPAFGRVLPGWGLTPASTVFWGIFSTPALQFCNDANPNYLGADFTFDLSYKMSVQDLIALMGGGSSPSSTNYGLISAVQQSSVSTTYAFILYLEKVTGKLKVTYGGATASDSIIEGGERRITQGTVDTPTTFSWVLSPGKEPDEPFWVGDGGDISAKFDPSLSTITNYGTNLVTSIDTYTLDTFVVETTSVAVGNIYIIYYGVGTDNSANTTIIPEVWNSLRVDHTGASINLYFDTYFYGGVDNGAIFPSFVPLAEDPVSLLTDALVVGALHSTTANVYGLGFNSPARGSVSDFRVSKSTLGAPVATSAAILSLASVPVSPETLLTQNMQDLSCVGEVRPPSKQSLIVSGYLEIPRSTSLAAVGDIILRPQQELACLGNIAGVKTRVLTSNADIQTDENIRTLASSGSVLGNYFTDLGAFGGIVLGGSIPLAVAGGIKYVTTANPLKAVANIAGVQADQIQAYGYLVRILASELSCVGSIILDRLVPLAVSGSIEAPLQNKDLQATGYIKELGVASLAAVGDIILRPQQELACLGNIAGVVTTSIVCDAAVSATVVDPNVLFSAGYILGVESATFNGRGAISITGLPNILGVGGMIQINPSIELTNEGGILSEKATTLAASGLVVFNGFIDISSQGHIQSTKIAAMAAVGNLESEKYVTLSATGRIHALEQVDPLYAVGGVQTIKILDLLCVGDIATPYTHSMGVGGYIDIIETNQVWLPASGAISITGNPVSMLALGNVKAPLTKKLYCFGKIVADTGLIAGSNDAVTGGQEE